MSTQPPVDWTRWDDTMDAFWHITRLALRETKDPEELVSKVYDCWASLQKDMEAES